MKTDLRRLLIIADEKLVVEELLEYFDANGYETEIALNTKTAVNIINERKMDIVIIGLKDQKSLDLVHDHITIISETNSSIPIIVLGGEKSKRTENKLIKAGATKCCPNPIEKEELLNVLNGFTRP
ncbi:MAG: response regulator [Candidatus Anammoxibacter sp.]